MNFSVEKNGFTGVELILVLATLVIVGGTGYFTFRHMHKTPHTTSNSSSSNNSSSSGNNSGSNNFTGIYGVITNGGCAGAIRVNGTNNCYAAPQAGMIVTATNYSNKKTFSALTDSKGSYRLFTVPGTYTVDTHSSKQNVIAECQESTGVVVKQDMATKLNFDCDNGLR